MQSISKVLVSSAGLTLAATSNPGAGGAEDADGAADGAGDAGPRRSSSKMAILGMRSQNVLDDMKHILIYYIYRILFEILLM